MKSILNLKKNNKKKQQKKKQKKTNKKKQQQKKKQKQKKQKNIRILQIRKKMTKVGFEHWLIWSDYIFVV